MTQKEKVRRRKEKGTVQSAVQSNKARRGEWLTQCVDIQKFV
jgi:hypothetical protein